jgi:uncharacterized repeat protein (TIGR01451 family)
MARRRFVRLFTVGALVALQFGAVSPPAANAYGVLGQFEIDGNLADDSGDGDPLDWATFTGATPIPDLSNSNQDNIFGNGSKDDDQSTWSCVKQKAPGKDDIVSGQIGFRRPAGPGTDQFAYINFFRKETSGDAHMAFEFNKSTTPASASCAAPKRSVGDILISFDTSQGGQTIDVAAYTYNGTAFTGGVQAANATGATNIPPKGLTIPGHSNGDFGEAAINLSKTIGDVTCGEFSGAYLKTRSSTSLDAALKDFTTPVKINPDNCPNSSLAKAVRNVSANQAFTTSGPTSTTASPGQTLEYRLTYSNAGPGTALNVQVTDAIQGNQTFASCSQTPACTTNGPPITQVSWNLGSVAAGASKSVTFQTTLASSFPAGATPVTNVASVTTTQETTPKDSNTVTTTVNAAPVDTFTKGVRNVTSGATAFTSGTNAARGDTVEYQLSYDNSGNASATNVVLSDPIPAQTTFVSCSATCTQNTTDGKVTSVSWTIGTVAPSDPVVTRTFQVQIDSTGFTQGASVPITNVAKVCTTQNPACTNSPPVIVTVKTPALVVAKAVSNVTTGTAFGTSTTAKPGDVLEYRLRVTNPGAADATSVTLSDSIAALQTFLSCSNTCTQTGTPVSSVSWNLGTVAAGTTTPIERTFRVTLASTFPTGTTQVKNTAVADSPQQHNVPSNETTTGVTAAPVDNPSKAARNATSNPTGSFTTTVTANPGDSIEYQLGYQNTGTANATNVVLSDPIPTHSTFVSCSNSCTQTKDANNVVTAVSWSLGTVAPNQAPILRTFIVKLDTTGFTPGSSTPVTNVAKVCTTENPACTTPPPVTVTVQAPKSSLAKAVRNNTVNPTGLFTSSTTAQPGDLVEYQLTYTNAGPGKATNVVVSDPIPARTTYQSCSANLVACATTGTPVTSVSWTLAEVPSGGVRVFTFVVKLDSSFPAGTTTITNVGTADSAEEPPVTSPPATVTVTATPALQLIKSSNASAVVIAGDQITYTLTYTNNGSAPAGSAVITENVPAGTTFVSCSAPCSGGTSVVSWSVGTVDPGAVGSVTMTVAVNATTGCSICNTATIASVDQNNGVPVSSNQVCATAQPADNPAGAHASGSALGAHAEVTLLGINTDLATTSSTKSGVGLDAHQNQLDLGPLNPILIPSDGSVLDAGIMRVASTSSVTSTPARANNTSVAETVGVKLLKSSLTGVALVSADVVEGVASASADGGSSTYSSAGSTFKNLKVAGVAYNNVTPNTTINVGDILGIGTGITVALREEVGSTTSPAGTSGGTYSSDLKVNMIHVHVGDSLPLVGGKQVIDVIVSQAVAHADFPQTRVCATSPTRSVSGHAYIAGAQVLGPGAITARVIEARILPGGGQDDASAAHTELLPDMGPLAGADTAEAFASGGFGPTSSVSRDFASAANVCIRLTGTACDISASAVRSVSTSSASALARSSADSYSDGVTNYTTDLVNVTIGGQSLNSLLVSLGLPPLLGTPPPNTVIAIPGLATIVLNEQFCDGNGTLVNHCADATTGHAGLTVRAIHVILVDGTPPLADVIVAEAHSDATWK